ncbi:hypothetical protein [Bradyrhizobium sp. USDA 4529]
MFDIAASRASRAFQTGDGSACELTPINCRQQFKPFVKVKRDAMIPDRGRDPRKIGAGRG